MKFLIYFLCFFVNAIITTLLRKNGIGLGAVPTVIFASLTFWVAKKICEAWDNRGKKSTKSSNNESPEPEVVKTPDSEKAPDVCIPCEIPDTEEVILVESAAYIDEGEHNDVPVEEPKTDSIEEPKVEEEIVAPVAQKDKGNIRMSKKRFCRICGTEINPKTKQCPNCGKQYFRWKWSHLFLTLSHLALCVALVVCLIEYDYLNDWAYKEHSKRVAAEQKYAETDFTNRPTVTDGWVITYDDTCHTKCCSTLDKVLKEINVAKLFHSGTTREEVEARIEEIKLEKLGFTAKAVALSEDYKLCPECFAPEYAEE